MNITVFGIGYVGAVVAGCMSAAGHHVVAVDVNPAKVATLNAGRSPLAEPGLAELIASGVAEGRLRATADSDAAFAHGEILFVCVGTPGLPNNRLGPTLTSKASRRISAANSPPRVTAAGAPS